MRQVPGTTIDRNQLGPVLGPVLDAEQNFKNSTARLFTAEKCILCTRSGTEYVYRTYVQYLILVQQRYR
jgi:hypothetical protein